MSERSTDTSLPLDFTHDSAFDALLDGLATPPSARPVPEVGCHVGRDDRFLLKEVLGKGGQGVVFRAEDLALNRTVAIKVVLAEQAEDDRTWARRCDAFDDETQLLAQLQNPYIVVIYDRGRWHDVPFIVMEFLRGAPLYTFIKSGPLKLELAVDVAFQIASGLKAAHTIGVVHRDLKPENIFILSEDTPNSVRILDFGMAWFNPEMSSLTDNRLEVSERKHGGTASYMSPEQWNCIDEQDHRTDIWALGVILAEMLTGEHPFRHSDLSFKDAILQNRRHPIRLTNGEPQRALTKLIDCCLATNPDRRIQNIHIFLRELNNVKRLLNAPTPEPGPLPHHVPAAGPPPSRSRHLKRGLALGVILALVILLISPYTTLLHDRTQFLNQVNIHKHQIEPDTSQLCLLEDNNYLSVCLFGTHHHRKAWRPFYLFVLVSASP